MENNTIFWTLFYTLFYTLCYVIMSSITKIIIEKRYNLGYENAKIKHKDGKNVNASYYKDYRSDSFMNYQDYVEVNDVNQQIFLGAFFWPISLIFNLPLYFVALYENKKLGNIYNLPNSAKKDDGSYALVLSTIEASLLKEPNKWKLTDKGDEVMIITRNDNHQGLMGTIKVKNVYKSRFILLECVKVMGMKGDINSYTVLLDKKKYPTFYKVLKRFIHLKRRERKLELVPKWAEDLVNDLNYLKRDSHTKEG